MDEQEESKTALAEEHEITDLKRTFISGHKQAITCLQWMPDNKSIITGSKDCNLIQCK